MHDPVVAVPGIAARTCRALHDHYSSRGDGRWHSGLRFLHPLTMNELTCVAGEKAMTLNDRAQQTRTEAALLKHHSSGLRATLKWKVTEGEFARKQSTLVFILRSFQYHLNRLLSLEENDGYMAAVLATEMEIDDRVDALKQDHDALRAESTRIVHRLGDLCSLDWLTFDTACDDLQALLKKLDMHEVKRSVITR